MAQSDPNLTFPVLTPNAIRFFLRVPPVSPVGTVALLRSAVLCLLRLVTHGPILSRKSGLLLVRQLRPDKDEVSDEKCGGQPIANLFVASTLLLQ